MSLKDEFNIPQNTWTAMIKRGVISCSVSKAEDILSSLKKKKDEGSTHSDAVKQVSLEMRISEVWVYEIIRRYK